MSANALQGELVTGRFAVLDVIVRPKMQAWCALHKRDDTLTGINALFKAFVLTDGAEYSACRLT